MTSWPERPRIQATMLNPALIAAIEAAAARDYERAGEHAMSWPLAFLVAPLVLHRPTRQALPRDTRTHLSTWVARNPLLRAGFPPRARTLAPLVREGIRFGIRERVLSVEAGTLHGSISTASADEELERLLKSAGLVGRWLAKTEQPSTAFALLGVAP
jgi:hypothetical protein